MNTQKFEKRFKQFILDYEANVKPMSELMLGVFRETFSKVYREEGFEKLDRLANLQSNKEGEVK